MKLNITELNLSASGVHIMALTLSTDVNKLRYVKKENFTVVIYTVCDK